MQRAEKESIHCFIYYVSEAQFFVGDSFAFKQFDE